MPRASTAVPMSPVDPDPIVIVPYDPRWPKEFEKVGRRLRSRLGATAIRIDHIGSTAVPGLAAKPVVDVQVSVAALTPEDPYRGPLELDGFVWMSENVDRTKRFFREPPGAPRTHIHVREAGSFDEQLNLLFRDFLRAMPDRAREYEETKRALADRFRHDRPGYVAAKEPAVWTLLRHAHDWSQATGWRPGPSDA